MENIMFIPDPTQPSWEYRTLVANDSVTEGPASQSTNEVYYSHPNNIMETIVQWGLEKWEIAWITYLGDATNPASPSLYTFKRRLILVS